jgi:hypothetical protein
MLTQYVWTKEEKTEMWGEGSWTDEPDALQWLEEKTQQVCVIWRHVEFGSLNGYVGVPKEHPCYEMPLANVAMMDWPCGITYANPLDYFREVFSFPTDEYLNYWYIGFDCMHAQDMVPGLPIRLPGATYKPYQYVRELTELLAQALHAYASS